MLQKSGMPKDSKTLKAIQSIYEHVQSSVKCSRSGLSGYFECTIGVKQGCKISPKLFNLFINELAKEVAKQGKHGIQLVPNGKEIVLLLFADDIVLISETVGGASKSVKSVRKANKAARIGG